MAEEQEKQSDQLTRHKEEEKERIERQDNEGLGALTSSELVDIIRSPELDCGSDEWQMAFRELAIRG